MTAPPRPRLRNLVRHALRRGHETWVVLSDPLGVSDPVALPPDAAPLLDLLDGQRTAAQIRQSLLMRSALDIATADIEVLVTELGEAGLLDDQRFRARWELQHRAFVTGDVRPARHAGLLYAADAREAWEQLRALLGAPEPRTRGCGRTGLRERRLLALLCPHQPPGAASSLLDVTLRGLPPAGELDAIVILGTDHGAGLLPFALTKKPYQTPLHTAPVADAMAEEIIEQVPWATREEIRHRGGHSIELAALLLHFLYDDACPPILPVLCGPRALAGGAASEGVDRFLAAMERALGRRRVLLWASAELGHAGPAFGGDPLTPALTQALTRRDHALLDTFASGQPERLRRRCGEPDDALGNASGAAVLVTLARLLPIGYRAELVRYCTHDAPGDEDGIAGLAGVHVYDS